jgi:hypothetical protein
VFYYVVIGIPVAQILHRTGFSRWLALLVLVPLLNLVALWIFAFGSWRAEFVTEKSERERNRERDNWSDAEKEAFRAAMNKPRS